MIDYEKLECWAGKLLQIFEGTVTEISCSTMAPSFFIDGIYTSQHYDQLPGLFGIEAIVAPDRSNVTLRINGTSLTDNVTIECQNIIDPVIGYTETQFQCTMVFVGITHNKFIIKFDTIASRLFRVLCNIYCSLDTLPSSTSIHLDGNTLLWAPPTQFQRLPNVSTIRIDPLITHYMLYITDLSISSDSEIIVRSWQPRFTFPCVYSVQVSAVNSAGEGERSNITIIDSECELFL